MPGRAAPQNLRGLIAGAATQADAARRDALVSAASAPGGAAAIRAAAAGAAVAPPAQSGRPGRAGPKDSGGPPPAPTAADWALAGRWLGGAELWSVARAAYGAAVRLAPASGEYAFRLGGVQARLWDIEGALATYARAEALGFPAVACRYQAGLLHLAAERPTAALAAFDACLAADGVPHVVLPHTAVALRRLGRLAAAEAAETEAVSYGQPEAAHAWHTLGRILLDRGLPTAARDAFRRAAAQPEARWRSTLWLGRTELTLGRADAALGRFRRLYDAGVRDVTLSYWGGAAGQAAGRLDIADFAYTVALQRAPGHAAAWRGVGELEQLQGRYAAAAGSYGRALALGGDSAALHYGLGELAMVREDWPAARAALERAVARDPHLAGAWQKLGAVRAELGDLGAARRAFARAYGPRRMAWDVQRWLERLTWGVGWAGAFLMCVIVGARLRRGRAAAPGLQEESVPQIQTPLASVPQAQSGMPGGAAPGHAVAPAAGQPVAPQAQRRIPGPAAPVTLRGRIDLAMVLALGLLVPIGLFIGGQRLLYASFELQRLTNRQIIGLSTLVGARDAVFLGLLPLAYMWWRRRGAASPAPVPHRWRRAAHYALLGVGGFAVFTVGSLVAARLRGEGLGGSLPPRGPSVYNDTARNLAASLVGIGLVSSVAQEVFYRGILYPLTRDQVGTVAAAVLTAVLFAGFHFQAVGFWWFTAFGLLAAALYQRTGSLIAPAVMHVLYNSWQVVT